MDVVDELFSASTSRWRRAGEWVRGQVGRRTGRQGRSGTGNWKLEKLGPQGRKVAGSAATVMSFFWTRNSGASQYEAGVLARFVPRDVEGGQSRVDRLIVDSRVSDQIELFTGLNGQDWQGEGKINASSAVVSRSVSSSVVCGSWRVESSWSQESVLEIQDGAFFSVALCVCLRINRVRGVSWTLVG